MKIKYDEHDDILVIEFSGEPIVRDVSCGWNVNIGFAETGVAEITILDAAARGYWPLEPAEPVISHITPAGGNIFADLGFEPEEAARLLAESDAIIDAELATKGRPARRRR